MELVARQLLRAVRGRRSQVAFSRRLGYRGNPVADWEAGRRFPTAGETLRACEVAGIDLAAAFGRFHEGTSALVSAADDDVAAWLRAHLGQATAVSVAERMDRSRYAVARWLAGRTRPRLPDFLRLVEALTGQAAQLVAELVPIGAVPALAERQTARRAAARLAFDEPWTAAVLRVLETAAYQALPVHEVGFVAEVLSIPVSREARCLDELERAGVVQVQGGRYVPVAPLTVDPRADAAEMRALGATWSDVSVARQRAARREGDMFSYNLFSASREDLERIRELHLAYYREVRAIVAASEPSETVAMIQVHLMEWPVA
jgi:transcriptional regulator with XRE-family HTH domain